MSRYADLLDMLPDLLDKYPAMCHKAIVETFVETLEEDWLDEDINSFLCAGLNVSQEADDEIISWLES